jgi:hypothetical protein
MIRACVVAMVCLIAVPVPGFAADGDVSSSQALVLMAVSNGIMATVAARNAAVIRGQR